MRAWLSVNQRQSNTSEWHHAYNMWEVRTHYCWGRNEMQRIRFTFKTRTEMIHPTLLPPLASKAPTQDCATKVCATGSQLVWTRLLQHAQFVLYMIGCQGFGVPVVYSNHLATGWSTIPPRKCVPQPLKLSLTTLWKQVRTASEGGQIEGTRKSKLAWQEISHPMTYIWAFNLPYSLLSRLAPILLQPL